MFINVTYCDYVIHISKLCILRGFPICKYTSLKDTRPTLSVTKLDQKIVALSVYHFYSLGFDLSILICLPELQKCMFTVKNSKKSFFLSSTRYINLKVALSVD